MFHEASFLFYEAFYEVFLVFEARYIFEKGQTEKDERSNMQKVTKHVIWRFSHCTVAFLVQSTEGNRHSCIPESVSTAVHDPDTGRMT